jgi:DNA-binding CsgD family transcriptional regulator
MALASTSAPLPARALRAALAFVSDLADAIDDPDGFARCGVERLPQLAASELTTLSLCDLRGGRRHVIGVPRGAIGADARASFDRHFRAHPLVRYHGHERGERTRRISDCLRFGAFRRTALYDEYYRAIGIDHALALPVHVGDGWLVSFVLNRRGRDFDEREVALLDLVRPALSRLFRRTRLLERTRGTWSAAGRAAAPAPPALVAGLPLTQRERDVLRWVAAGKTDRDVADILSISHRTVHKHLQRIYGKLGVETRTAAVMRALAPASAQHG